MVWDAAELSGPVVFRWYRSTWTDLQPVTLTLSHPFTALELQWSAARTAYESRPVVLPCGRFSGTLRVNGVTRPLAPFRVTRFTFEVLLFLSNDVDESAADEPDLPRYIPHLGSYMPGRLRTAAAVGLVGLEEAQSPTTAAVERQHQQLVTRLAGVALLGELSADVHQLRRQTSANGRQVQALTRELRQERLQRHLAEAVRREVALLRAGSPRRGRRGSGADKAGQPGGKRRRRPPPPPPRAGDSEEWEDVPDCSSRKASTTDTGKHQVTFDEATTGEGDKEAAHGLETANMEKVFVYEDLCREECPDTEAEVKAKKDVLRELAQEPTEDEEDPEFGGPFGSNPDLYEIDHDLSHVPGSPPFVRYRTAGGDEVTVRPAPSQLTQTERIQLLSPWRPWYPSDLTPGQRATVLTGGQVIRGDISHIWTSAGQTLVSIETNGWEDVTVPFGKVIMVC